MRKNDESLSKSAGADRQHADDGSRAERADRFKLPRAKSTKRKNAGNRWVEVDRNEKIKAVVTVAVVLAALGAGLWVLFHGVAR